MLNNMWDIENQLIAEFPKMINHAGNADLKKELTDHLEKTRNHKIRLEELLSHHAHTLTYERDMAFQTLLQDTASDLSLIDDQNVKDAFIAASAQTVEHIELSKYRTLYGWAKELGDEFGALHMRNTLNEEEAASKKLATIAEGGLFTTGINEKAVITGEDT
jgi:ferritin-like metal-binding protein YciE